VIKTDSEAPFTIDSTVVYSDKENGLLLLDENIDYNHYKFVYLYGLVYDECVNLIIEDQPGNTMLTTLYTYNDGFDTAWVNKAIRSDGAIISCQAGYGDYLAPIRLIWDPNKKEYKGIGREKISYKKLIEEIPEMELLCAEIERYYGKEIDFIETAGGLNFYFNFDVPESVTLENSDGEYVIQYSGFTVAAYIEDSVIKSDITFRRYDYDGYYEEIAEHHDDIDNDIAYGLFLTYAVPAE
ncbi:MAG: hypothetical protein J1E40_06605, partial [Oscillospiraceae bacterium]|nr:hypothetical protein [Oscillospiraceae bacterium]